jgi:hypothetical protein
LRDEEIFVGVAKNHSEGGVQVIALVSDSGGAVEKCGKARMVDECGLTNTVRMVSYSGCC